MNVGVNIEKIESLKVYKSQGDTVNYSITFRHSSGEMVKVDTQLDLNQYISYHKRKNLNYN